MISIREMIVHKDNQAICQVDQLNVSAGARIWLQGANGAGKTTLLRVLAGLEFDFSGDCEVRAKMRDRCLVHQAPYLFRGTVMANVTYGLRARGASPYAARTSAGQILASLGILDSQNHLVRSLSGGERRRVAIARALVLEPSLLLLDEPFADLDPGGKAAILAEIDKLAGTVVLASPSEDSDLHAWRTIQLHKPE